MSSALLQNVATAAGVSPSLVAVLAGAAVAALLAYLVSTFLFKEPPVPAGAKLPPVVPSSIPFIGNAIEFGTQPVKFLQKWQKVYGDCFTFVMFGQKMVVALGPDGNNFFFNVPITHTSAEKIYRKLTAPVFGSGVVYDVENPKFMEQKKFIKDALTTAAFKSYVSQIVEEIDMFYEKKWAANEDTVTLFMDMSELTIMTASRCLQGKEIRAKMSGRVAKLYHDLDKGFTAMNVFFEWLPIPQYINRDRANKELTDIFESIIKSRTISKDTSNMDVLQSLMAAKYKNGDPLQDYEIAHILIALLMAGQHTSSTTISWVLFNLASNKKFIHALLEEQSTVLTGKPDTPIDQFPELDYETIRKMPLLESTIKEALRLTSPIHTVMRQVIKDIDYKGYTIPAGYIICGSPSVSQRDETRFTNPDKFDPYRHINSTEGNAEWTINGVDIAQKSAKSHFLPFGAGRHRCIGEAFAYVQIKTIICMTIRRYDLDLHNEKMPVPDYSGLIVVPVAGSKLVYKARKPGVRPSDLA